MELWIDTIPAYLPSFRQVCHEAYIRSQMFFQTKSFLTLQQKHGRSWYKFDLSAVFRRSEGPNDFLSLFLLIISTTAWIDFIGSLPIIGLALIGSASRSFGAVVGVVVLDHKTLPIISLSITASLEITALVVVGIAGLRLLDFIGYKRSERKKGDLYAYLKLLGLALSISFLSALFESASILGMLPFGL